MSRSPVRLLAMILAGAGAASAARPADAPGPPAARVEANKVVHRGEGVTIRVPAAAAYVGSERFTLYGIADAEIHVFVEADGKRRVRRLYWIQFESYLPSLPDRRYDYSDNKRAELWGHVTWTGAGPRRTDAPPRPGSDGEHVRALLARAGYALPPETMSARLVQILDDPAGTGRGREELMLIYGENLAPTGRRYAELVRDGATTPAWEPLEAPLIERAAKAFRVERQ